MFQVRTRMLDLKKNYGGRYEDKMCPLCHSEEYTQEHLLVCEILDEEYELVNSIPEYENIFWGQVDEKLTIGRIMKTRYCRRKEYLEEMKKNASGPSDP